MVSWQASDLSTNPASVDVASTDDDVLRFPYGDETVSAATAILTTIGTGTDVTDETLGLVTIQDGNVLVPYSNLTEGLGYRLKLVLTDPAGLDWTNVLVLICVA